MAKSTTGFSDAEKDAMRNRAKELAAEAKISKNRAEGEKAIKEAIAKMPEPDKSMATRLHVLIKAAAPDLWPKTWYGMPSYATKEGKVVCFFQAASKFKYRYATLGFQEDAHLDEGNLWPTSYAVKKLTSTEETKITALVRQAVS